MMKPISLTKLAAVMGLAALVALMLSNTGSDVKAKPPHAGGGKGVTDLCVNFWDNASNGMSNSGVTEYCHSGGGGILAQISGKGQFTFASGSDAVVAFNLPTGPPVGAYRVGPMITFGDGITSPTDLNELPLDTPTGVALEIHFHVDDVQTGNVHTWSIIFRGPSDADFQCEEGDFATVTRDSLGWTIVTTADDKACLYETYPSGKGKQTTRDFHGKINCPIFVTLDILN